MQDSKVILPTVRHNQSLQYAIRQLCDNFPEYVEEIYLYGSCARGKEKYSSDVDLLVKVTKETSPRIMRRMKAEIIAESPELPQLDLHFFSGQTYSPCRQFNKNLEKEGRLVWKKD